MSVCFHGSFRLWQADGRTRVVARRNVPLHSQFWLVVSREGMVGEKGTHDGTQEHDIVASHQEEAEGLLRVLLPHVDALHRLLQHQIG